ncbi:MAG: 50S ribosomal protein L20 [Candidatus Portnoybacteria bacterium CG10_big_fil_rev_8_21_14_0_10_38_18]|uniref:Large ribosomal subunit protein bL20 n=1 Tax=Candidatus Portnoybacteria bacterium CG10_big_fil_rev_8_21_14_0_10_38_18 TaxID=1974813 RepID=A0A2M8KC70_9BACT|nr:MAG: 50S ribosomal protein L20 [Candidatus Portnoybacteria bacterium CG10_big_fil_rev_8_21_14_0_10_38_18]
MSRVKRGVAKRKRRKNIIKQAKGFKWGRKAKFRLAKDALRHAWAYAYRDRRAKKREFRQLWNIKINAICRENNISYSKFINAIKKNNIDIDRKILAQLAEFHPDIFKKIIEEITHKN